MLIEILWFIVFVLVGNIVVVLIVVSLSVLVMVMVGVGALVRLYICDGGGIGGGFIVMVFGYLVYGVDDGGDS